MNKDIELMNKDIELLKKTNYKLLEILYKLREYGNGAETETIHAKICEVRNETFRMIEELKQR